MLPECLNIVFNCFLGVYFLCKIVYDSFFCFILYLNVNFIFLT